MLAFLVILSACTHTNNSRHPDNQEKTLANVPPEPATNSPAVSKPAPTVAVIPGEGKLETERNELLEADMNFSRLSEEKGAAQAFYEFLAPDGISLSAGEPPIRGRDAIKVHLAAGRQGFLSWQPVAAEISRGGDMGFTWGTAVFQEKGVEEKPRLAYSKYVTVWKQMNGRWRVVLYSNSPSPSPAVGRQ